MAAFEAVSKLRLQSGNQESIIDVRLATLPTERPPPDDFDPADLRDLKNPIKPWMAHFNLMRTFFGAGVLGLPLAVSQAGIILGPIMSMSLGLIIMHMHATLILLEDWKRSHFQYRIEEILRLCNFLSFFTYVYVKGVDRTYALWCLTEICRQLKIPQISYRYGFRIALLHGPSVCHRIGNCGPTIIATFMLLSQLGICTVFVIFTSDCLRDILDWQNSQPAMALLLAPYLIFLHFMKSLNIVSYVSLMGTFLNFVGLFLVLYHIFQSHRGVLMYATNDLVNIFFVTGTCLFNLSAVGVVLSLNKALKDPRVLTQPFGVIRLEMFVVTVLLTVFGALGYWSFGTMEENVLRSLPYDENITMVTMGIYLFSIAFAYPIQCYPAIQIILEIIRNKDADNPPSNKTMQTIELIARPLFVLTTFSVCYFIPIQGAFVAFVGNLCTTLIALVFPALMELCILYPKDYGKHHIYLIKNILIITFGLTAWLFGAVLCGDLIYVRVLSLNSRNNNMEY